MTSQCHFITFIMSDDEDDYLSDKFLAEGTSSTRPQTYSNLRKEAQKKALLKNEQHRQKSRYQREVESREEGLSKSLFTRAKEEQEAGIATGNKAMSIMMKMGFKPGQSLGKTDDEPADAAAVSIDVASSSKKSGGHKVEPLPLNEWEGELFFRRSCRYLQC